jgi:hypothetical protein
MTSMPGVTGSSGRTIMFWPFTRSMSFKFSGIAWTRTRSSPGPGSGTGISSRVSALVGSAPHSWTRQARMDSERSLGPGMEGLLAARSAMRSFAIERGSLQSVSGSRPKRSM